LYTRCLDRLCSALKDYALTRYGRTLRCFVPTHSLINYTQWGIISPQSRLLDVPTCDGYVAQVWTGTARTPNVYEGRSKERTFETAFLEYGIMQELVRGTDRRIWFLHDPVEDNPRYTWEDYRRNYQCTLVASLLHPAVWRYEVTPWPHRVFGGRYRREATGMAEGIPPAYATELLVAMNSFARVRNQDSTEGHFSFTSECPLGVRVRTALRVAIKPTRVCIDGEAVDRYEFDERVGVLWLQHDGKPSGTVVQIDF
jgi:hypothetical protein